MILELNPNSIDDYRKFLRIKSLPAYSFTGRLASFPDEYAASLGVKPPSKQRIAYEPLDGLFDYQQDIVRLAIRKRKFAIFAQCGLGKTLMLLEFAKHAAKQLRTAKRTLIVSPLMVVRQTIEEARQFYGDSMAIEQVAAADLQSWLNGKGCGIGITNYDALRDDVYQGRLGALILDECFPAGTPVLCIDNFGNKVEKRIENILCGDRIINASGVDRVIRTKRKEVSHAVAITAGERITCSPNHPFFTQRGWVCAQDVRPGDSILSSDQAVRMVREAVSTERYSWAIPVLQSILLSEMENESVDSCCESSYKGNAREDWAVEGKMVPGRQQGSKKANCSHSRTEPNDRPEGTCESFYETEENETQTFRAWWQRDGLDGTAEDFAGCFVRELEGGVCCIAGPATAGISHTLQARLSESRANDRHRSGWCYTSLSQSERPEERCEAGFVRVESLEILESGHPDLERLRDADGALYFYDIEAERHPSYSVAGLLVHNSSYLKSHYGNWAQKCIELGAGLEWKLALTGTPAPNDRIEFANHAVFLDHFPNTNAFLAKFFVNRGQTGERWELRPHALRAFYTALSHWCIFLESPATYGWKDNVGNVPPIHTHIHHVDLTQEQEDFVRGETGDLFAANIGGIGSRGKLGQIAKGTFKGQEIATNKPAYIKALVESWPDESTIIWCLYDAEQELMEQTFPDAVSLRGSTPMPEREAGIEAFKSGANRVMVSKGKILGYGLNLQRCTRMVFSGLQDSYETYWQCVKRANRIGSTQPLNVHIPITDLEAPMVENVMRKAHRINEDAAEQESLFKQHNYLGLIHG